ncbi:NAD(P)/FAD-dependent oxidoreductase [Methanoregula sp.]|uniref:NAD(P)/FAD-dependent oxidoreductase n=1 Tax=Methanoregula sp. TaxID=2052170 RepID=UPI002BCF33D7|nr:NAD(P)/FAD-dependent oxidoreductase [Methanoregula sp.]HVP95806.1 NAD(P)/FAD-dependent oxidoreductase [Methanoregula sp.]
MEQCDTFVIGAGPAGLFCAIHAAGPGNRVLLGEKNAEPGAKLRISGTGQCNITHAGDIRTFFSRYGSHGQFLRPALHAFTNQDLVRFFDDRGLSCRTRDDGKVFPASRDAGEVLALLVRECHLRGVTLRCREPVQQVEYRHPGFLVHMPGGTIFSRHLVLATGGASYPKTGSTGDGYRIAASLGHSITKIGPALAPVTIAAFPFVSLAGMTFPALPFSVWRTGRKVISAEGDLLFTHAGLSGPGILDNSRDIRAGDEIRLSFAGPVQRDVLTGKMVAAISRAPTMMVKSLVSGLGIPERLAKILPDMAGVPATCTGAHLTATARNHLIDLLMGCPLTVSSVGDLSIAMVTRGGVALNEVNSRTMESKLVPGLFFAGEVLDIDGDTGGFNLQAAFSTGYYAAQGIRLKERKSAEQGPGKG